MKFEWWRSGEQETSCPDRINIKIHSSGGGSSGSDSGKQVVVIMGSKW
jgi:hypothetical protein